MMTDVTIEPEFNEDSARCFLLGLFKPALDANIDACFVIARRRELEKGIFGAQSFAVTSGGIESAVLRAKKMTRRRMDIYFRPALLKPEILQRPKIDSVCDADVIAQVAFWCDSDDGDPDGLLDDFGAIKPGAIVTTGTVPELRRQIWWWLQEATCDVAREWKPISKTISAHFKSDSSVANASSYMRLPGSVSFPKPGKTGRVMESVSVEILGHRAAFDRIKVFCRSGEASAHPALAAPHSGFGRVDAAPRPRAYFEKALENEAQAVRSQASPGRHQRLNRAAFVCGTLAADGHLDRAEIQATLADAGAVSMPEESPTEIARIIRGGIDAGMQHPRGEKLEVSQTGRPHRGREGSGAQNVDAAWPPPDMSLIQPVRSDPPVFPLDVFGADWANWLARAAMAKGSPPDYVAAGLLACAGALIGNARWPAPWSGWSEPPILWPVLIGAPSSGKSTGLDAVIAPLRRINNRLAAEAAERHQAWQARAELARLSEETWKAKVKTALKKGAKPPEKPEAAIIGDEPRAEKLFLADATTEAIGAVLSRQPKGLLIYRDELAGWLGNMTRYTNGGSDRPFWLEAYGGRSYPIERLSRPPLVVDNLSIGVLGGIQPDRLSSLLLRLDDDGLVARMLPFWPLPVPPVRPSSEFDDSLVETAFERLRELLMTREDDGRRRPWIVPFTEPARASLQRFREDMHTACNASEGLLASFLGKAAGFVVRLSLILAHLRWASQDGGREPEVIEAEWVETAIRFVRAYVIPMARRAYSEASVPAAVRAAQLLARFIHHERLHSVSIREIQRRKLSGLGEAREIRDCLQVLVEADWARMVTVSTDGRDKTLFRINPLIANHVAASPIAS